MQTILFSLRMIGCALINFYYREQEKVVTGIFAFDIVFDEFRLDDIDGTPVSKDVIYLCWCSFRFVRQPFETVC